MAIEQPGRTTTNRPAETRPEETCAGDHRDAHLACLERASHTPVLAGWQVDALARS